MSKKLSMEERLKIKVANLNEQERGEQITSESIPEKNETYIKETKYPKEETKPKRTFNLDEREKEEKQLKEKSTENDKTVESENTSEKKMKKKDILSNLSDKTKSIDSDKIVDFMRDGRGRYYIGGVILFLLMAYVFGVFISLVSDTKRLTVNPFKAIFYAITSGGMITFIVVAVVIFALIALFVTILGTNKKNITDRKFGNSDALGSGGMATEEDEDKLLIITKELDDQPYYVFGKNNKGLWVGMNPKLDINHFFAICGPQQSGKSFMLVKNNLTQLAKVGHSLIIGDPKGEMYRDMSQFFVEQNYVVKQFNLNDLYASDSWNILDDVNEDNIDLFAKTFIENLSDDKEEQTFKDMKFTLFKALVLYVIYEDKEINDDERILGRVYDMLAHTNSEQELDDKFLALSNSSKAKQTYMNWSLGGRLKTNSLATLSAKLGIFQKQALKEITGITDIDISLPGKKKCAYFLVLDDQNPTYSCLSSVFIKLLIESAVKYAKTTLSGTTDIRIHFMLDEFPTMGRIPDFKVGLGTWRGYGIDMSIIFQNIPQLMERYPNNVWNQILGACSTQICLGAYEDGDVTAEHYSKMGGVGTIFVDLERREHNKLAVVDTKALTQVAVTKSMQQSQAIYPSEVKDLILNKEMYVTIGSSKPFKFKKTGFNENKYYNTPKKATFENIPLWVYKLKNKTDFKTEYGGLYTLGRINELPERLQNMIQNWKQESISNNGEPISKDTFRITDAEKSEFADIINNFNQKQAKQLMTALEEIKSGSNVNSKKDINAEPIIVQFTSERDNDDKEEDFPEMVGEKSTEQKVKENIAFSKQPKAENKEKDIEKTDTQHILSKNGKTFIPREEVETKHEEKNSNTEKPIRFNVSFSKKN